MGVTYTALGFFAFTIILDKGGENAACLSSEASVAFAQSVGPVTFTTATAFKRFLITDGSYFNCGQSYRRECANVGQTVDTRNLVHISLCLLEGVNSEGGLFWQRLLCTEKT
jgi:hypothetical protein